MNSKHPIVCTVFDVAAREHGPIFSAPTMAVAWRNVDSMFEKAVVPRGEYLLFVHGNFDFSKYEKEPMFQPFLFPQVFSCANKDPIAFDGVVLMVSNLEDCNAKSSF